VPRQVNRIPGIKPLTDGGYQARVFHGGKEESKTFRRLDDAQKWQRNLKQNLERCPQGVIRSKRSWQASLITSSGVSQRSFVYLDDATEWLNRARVHVSMGTWLEGQEENLTFSDFVGYWIKSKKGIGGKTLATYNSQLNLHLLPFFGEESITSISTKAVKLWVSRLSDIGVGATTIKQAYRLLRQILQAATDEDRVIKNPCNSSVTLPKIVRKQKRGLTGSELEQLATSCGNYSTLIRFLGTTGVRVGEALALKVEDFDFVNGTVTVDKSWTTDSHGKKLMGATKTKNSRLIPLTSAVLQQLTRTLETKSLEDWVFTGLNGGCLDYGWFRRRIFVAAVKQCGFNNVQIHTLRHTCASLLISLNAPITTVSYILGHSSVKMTLDTYGHYYEDDTAEWMVNLGKFLTKSA